MTTLRAMPILPVRDVARSVAFYERAGFASHGIWTGENGGEGQFAILQRGAVTLAVNLLHAPDMTVDTFWSAYVYVENAEALHSEFQDAGLDPSELSDRPYGCRDFEIADPDGHKVAFGQDMIVNEYGPGLGPERGRG